MIWKNTADRYGVIAKTLHWTIALLVIMMLVMGWVMGSIPNGPDKFWVYSLHKSIGITILGLVVVRLGWKLMNWNMPGPHTNHKPWERVLSDIVHWGFYVLLLAQPLSGWFGTAAANSTINWFGLSVIPNPVAPSESLRDTMFGIHEFIPWVLLVFIGLHIAGAVKHAVIDRDDTLNRMVPFASLLLVLAFPILAHATDVVKPPVWSIDRAKSTLAIQATQEGGKFDGKFTAFDGKITMDPAKPESGTADITIDLNSFASGLDSRDSSVKEKDWFDIAEFPTATYHIMNFAKGTDKDTYTAHGTLSLRGIQRPLDIPFTLTTVDENGVRTAHATGKTSLKRLDFDVGGGQWKDESMVGNDVAVVIDLYATTKAQ